MPAISTRWYRLLAGEPRKSFTTDDNLGTLDVTASGVAIFIPFFMPDKLQQAVGMLDSVHTWAQSNLKDLPLIVALPSTPARVQTLAFNGSDPKMVTGDPSDPLLSVQLYIGADIVQKNQSHLLDSTYKLLRDVLLEQWKAP